MRITIIMGPFGYIPPKGIGAIEKLWYDLAIEFAKEGHSVEIISKKSKGLQVTDKKEDMIRKIYISGYNRGAHLVKDLFFDFIYSFNALCKVKNTDVLIMNTFWSPFLCRFFKSDYDVSIYNVARYPKGQFKYLSHIDKLVACSSMIEHAVIQQNPNQKNILTINNPVNLDIFKPEEYNSIERNTLHLVYSGRIHPEKGLVNLVKAASLLAEKSSVKLSFIGTSDLQKGGGGEEYRRQLTECAKNVDLVFTGEMSDPQQMANYMKTADIYCYPPLPTTGDAMPCAPLEAMALGLPVIVSDLPCFDDYLVHNKNGIRFDVSHNAVEHLQQAIELLIMDKSLRMQIRMNAVKMVSDFSCPNIAKQYLSLFQSLLHNGKSLA